MIQYPVNNSEFEIQSELYYKLRESGYNVRGEVKHAKCRFDIVVYDSNNNAICIIECKRYVSRYKKPKQNTKQIAKYSQYNIPVLVCVRIPDIPSVISSLDAIVSA